MPEADLSELIEVSRAFGGRPGFALAGGGNTSLKTGDTLWVKASGHRLATIDAGGFVALDRRRLSAMLDATDWPGEPAAREALFVERVMAARLDPHAGRPSVEALLHHLLPDRLVVHTHPRAVNALTCCVRGEALAAEALGGAALWQPYVDPGLTLAKDLRGRLRGRAGGRVVLMENHGLVGAPWGRWRTPVATCQVSLSRAASWTGGSVQSRERMVAIDGE